MAAGPAKDMNWASLPAWSARVAPKDANWSPRLASSPGATEAHQSGLVRPPSVTPGSG